MAQPTTPDASAATGKPALHLDPRTFERGLACVHCGLCLPACPTYTENGLEADSPRGRIQLMLGLHEGKIEPSEKVRHHLDLCLDCRACETACPSSVQYHELIEETRSKLPPARQSIGDRIVRFMFLHVLTRPRRLKLALLPARVMQKVGLYGLMRKVGMFRILPKGLRKMEQMLPARGTLWPSSLPRQTSPLAVSPTKDPPKAHVAFFSGCIGSVMFDEVNQKAVDLLAACGCQVTALPGNNCCGAIHHHNGIHAKAESMARATIIAVAAAFADSPVDVPRYIVSTVAGCGAMLRDYSTLLRDDPAYAEKAKLFASRVRDVTELLAELGLPEMKHPVDLTVTYHDACHLVHAQKVAAQPRALLTKVPGLKLVPLAEADMCCGAAGTYNLTQPEMATDLAARKIGHIDRTGATLCATGNVGCAMHIGSEAAARGKTFEVVHPVELLHRAVFGDRA